MANSIIVLGKSGSGKTSSIKNLNPDETVVINVLKKVLPFKGSKTMYNSEKKNMYSFSNYAKVIQALKHISEKMTNVKTIVIDDAIYIMRKEFFERASETGFNKYTELALHYQQIIETVENLREDLDVFLMLHPEDVKVGDFTTTQKVATVGKLLDEKYNVIETVSILLYAEPQFDEKGVPQYGFYTKRKQINDVIINAKSPDGMFEEDFIPNDLQYVKEKMSEYFN